MEALARLQPDSARQHALHLLESDPSIRVRRSALRLLGIGLGEQRILQLAAGPATGLRNDAWRLLRCHYPWQELLYLLLGDEEARLRSWLLRFWRRSWLRPPAPLAGPLAAALAQNTWLTESQRHDLGFLSAP